MRLLFLSRWFPYPLDNGSKIRIYHLVRALAEAHDVDLLAFANEAPAAEHLAALQTFCRRVQAIPYRPFHPGRAQAILGYFSPKPRSVIDTFNKEMHAAVLRSARDANYDLVIASEIDMVPYAQLVADRPRILEELELTTIYEQYARERQPVRRARAALTWWKTARYAVTSLSDFVGVTVVSDGERERLRQIAPGYERVAVVPNGVDIDHYTGTFGPPQPDSLVYSGALTYNANLDAMAFFIGEIFPRIRALRPATQLLITGKNPPHLIEQLPKSAGVTFTGYLPDIRPTAATAWASIAPLRLGGGTRLKILEAMALGSPVISTAKGAEGLAVQSGQNILLADTPAEFAAAVVRVLGDAALRASLSQQALQLVRDRYAWPQITRTFAEFVAQVTAHSPKNLRGL